MLMRVIERPGSASTNSRPSNLKKGSSRKRPRSSGCERVISDVVIDVRRFRLGKDVGAYRRTVERWKRGSSMAHGVKQNVDTEPVSVRREPLEKPWVLTFPLPSVGNVCIV